VQFIADNICCPFAVSEVVRLRFLPRFASSNDAAFLLFELHVAELQPLVCTACNRQNFVGLSFGIILNQKVG